MATTIKISDTLAWILAFTVQRPNTGVANIANEPGLTAANKIMQSIASPPFRWSWNRVENTSITTVIGTNDYVVALANWGWLEKATCTDPVTGDIKEIEVSQVLAKDSTQNRPQKIAPILDDNAGNITFRMFPAPDQAYPIVLTYQKAAVQATTLGSTTWAPIPDRYAFLYEQGMLALIQGMYSTQLYMANIEIFWRQLVGAAEGMTETEKAIFLEDQLRIIRTGQNSGLSVTQGKQVRL